MLVGGLCDFIVSSLALAKSLTIFINAQRDGNDLKLVLNLRYPGLIQTCLQVCLFAKIREE